MVNILEQRDSVKAILLNQSRAQKLYDCIYYGQSDYIVNDSCRSHIYNETTKANIIHDYIIYRVKQIFSQDTSVRFVTYNKMFLLIIEDKIAVRFKKLDKRLKSKNVDTKNVEKFRLHKLDVGETELISLDAGYNLNTLRTEINEIYFVCPQGDKIRWQLSARDLSVKKQVVELFEPIEEEVIPITLNVKKQFMKDDAKAINQ